MVYWHCKLWCTNKINIWCKTFKLELTWNSYPKRKEWMCFLIKSLKIIPYFFIILLSLLYTSVWCWFRVYYFWIDWTTDVSVKKIVKKLVGYLEGKITREDAILHTIYASTANFSCKLLTRLTTTHAQIRFSLLIILL